MTAIAELIVEDYCLILKFAQFGEGEHIEPRLQLLMRTQLRGQNVQIHPGKLPEERKADSIIPASLSF